MPRRPRPATRGRRGARAYAVPTVALALSTSLVLAVAGCGQPTRSPDDSVAPTVSVAMQPTITPVTPSDDAPDAAATTGPRCSNETIGNWEYLGGTVDPSSIKWLIAMRVGDGERIHGRPGTFAFVPRVAPG